MPRTAAAFAAGFTAALIAVLPVHDGHAQDAAEAEAAAEDEQGPTAEDLIEVAREVYRPPGLRQRCPEGAPGEIVVCAPVDPDSFRVSSPTDDAIAAGEAVSDGVPRAPAMAPPPCDPRSPGCFKFGKPPPMPPMVDFDAIPEPLTPEEAARVFRAEDGVPEP